MAHYGIVYIIRNNTHPPNVYKVGMTTRSVKERIDELNRETSNVGRFEALAQFPVSNMEAAEAECHRDLGAYNLEKEFFKGPLPEIIEIVKAVARKYVPKEQVTDAARTKYYENGDRYVGEFEGDLRHGDGTCHFANGDTYTGSWQNDKQGGQGNYIESDETEYLGDWRDGQRHGIGSEIIYHRKELDPENFEGHGFTKLYVGEWRSDRKNGQGFIIFNTPGDVNFPLLWFGNFLNGKPKGEFYYWTYEPLGFHFKWEPASPDDKLKKYKSVRLGAIVARDVHVEWNIAHVIPNPSPDPDLEIQYKKLDIDLMRRFRDKLSYGDLVSIIDDLNSARGLMATIPKIANEIAGEIVSDIARPKP